MTGAVTRRRWAWSIRRADLGGAKARNTNLVETVSLSSHVYTTCVQSCSVLLASKAVRQLRQISVPRGDTIASGSGIWLSSGTRRSDTQPAALVTQVAWHRIKVIKVARVWPLLKRQSDLELRPGRRRRRNEHRPSHT